MYIEMLSNAVKLFLCMIVNYFSHFLIKFVFIMYLFCKFAKLILGRL